MEMKHIVTGKTIDEAKANAVAQLGLDADGFSYQVLQLPKSGFLGFGAQPAKIEVSYEVPDPKPEAPKVALSAASRSKPKPAKKPEAPKQEAPAKAEAPKTEAVKPAAPVEPKEESPKPEKKERREPKEKKPMPPGSRRSPKPPRNPRSMPLPNPAAWRKRSSSSSPAFWSTWTPRQCPTAGRKRAIHTRWSWWVKTWAT